MSEQMNYAGPDGAIAHGMHRVVISGQGATVQLTRKQSGALCLFDRAAGIVYTLPTPVVGMQFEFATTVTVTSNASRVITRVPASEFLGGAVNLVIAASAVTLGAVANGTSITQMSGNGSTTGGVNGDAFKVTAVSATRWQVEGIVSASGALATPFA